MKVRKLGPGDYRLMSWKNGRGSTLELMVEPEGATLDTGFLWRLSSADVPASGPFSAFPGYDRSLLLLEGEGLELDHGSHGRVRLEALGAPCRFDGAWATEGRLLGGPCRDFNVMSRQGAVRHELRMHRVRAELRLEACPTRLLHLIAGDLRIGPLDVDLHEGGLLRVDGGPALALRSTAPEEAVLLDVRIG